MRRLRQTALPGNDGVVSEEPVSSTGLSSTKLPKSTPKTPKSRRATLVRNPPHRFISTTVQTGAIHSQVLGGNKNRRYLLIQNVGLVTVWLGFGVVPKVNGDQSIEIPAGVEISFENGICPNNEIRAVSITSSRLAILEGNEF